VIIEAIKESRRSSSDEQLCDLPHRRDAQGADSFVTLTDFDLQLLPGDGVMIVLLALLNENRSHPVR